MNVMIIFRRVGWGAGIKGLKNPVSLLPLVCEVDSRAVALPGVIAVSEGTEYFSVWCVAEPCRLPCLISDFPC